MAEEARKAEELRQDKPAKKGEKKEKNEEQRILDIADRIVACILRARRVRDDVDDDAPTC